jgi:hypothetical protein
MRRGSALSKTPATGALGKGNLGRNVHVRRNGFGVCSSGHREPLWEGGTSRPDGLDAWIKVSAPPAAAHEWQRDCCCAGEARGLVRLEDWPRETSFRGLDTQEGGTMARDPLRCVRLSRRLGFTEGALLAVES